MLQSELIDKSFPLNKGLVMNFLSRLLSIVSIFTFVFIHQPQLSYAQEYEVSKDNSAIVKKLDKEIARVQKRNIPMSRFVTKFSKKFDQNFKRLENHARRSLRKNKNQVALKEKMIEMSRGTDFYAETVEFFNKEALDYEKDILDPYFSDSHKQMIRDREVQKFNQYEYLADYLIDLKSDLLGRSISSVHKITKLERSPADSGVVVFFLGFLGGALLVCLGGIISFIFPPAGTVIMLVGLSMILIAGTWAILND